MGVCQFAMNCNSKHVTTWSCYSMCLYLHILANIVHLCIQFAAVCYELSSAFNIEVLYTSKLAFLCIGYARYITCSLWLWHLNAVLPCASPQKYFLQHVGADNGQTDDMRDLREKYGFSADLSDEHLQEKLKEMKEHLRREIRKVYNHRVEYIIRKVYNHRVE